MDYVEKAGTRAAVCYHDGFVDVCFVFIEADVGDVFLVTPDRLESLEALLPARG